MLQTHQSLKVHTKSIHQNTSIASKNEQRKEKKILGKQENLNRGKYHMDFK